MLSVTNIWAINKMNTLVSLCKAFPRKQNSTSATEHRAIGSVGFRGLGCRATQSNGAQWTLLSWRCKSAHTTVLARPTVGQCRERTLGDLQQSPRFLTRSGLPGQRKRAASSQVISVERRPAWFHTYSLSFIMSKLHEQAHECCLSNATAEC